MAFSTENRKISDIFQRSAIYKVPRYQREYVWEKINWKELWKDIEFTVQNADKIPWTHFLGTIVLNNLKKKENGIDVYEIIDGQQRMMTLYIMLTLIYKNFRRLGDETSKNRSKYIYETFLTTLTSESKRVILIDNEVYKKDLKLIVDSATNIDSLDKNNKLYDVVEYFDSILETFDFSKLDKTLEMLLSINIVEIISGEDEEIYNIFEVLNARGQKLKQIELLKNHIMKYIQPREEEFIDSAKEKWSNIMINVEHLNNPDVLIQHFSKCYIEKNAENQNSIYRLIKEEVDINSLSIFLDDLVEFSEEYKVVTDKNSKDSNIEYFNIKRNQQIRSLLCAIEVLYKKGIIKEEMKKLAFEQIRNFFFIFNTTQQTSNSTDKLISEISYSIYNCKYENEFKIIFTDFLLKLKQYIQKKDYKILFESNQSFKYSNKDKTLKRNNKLVKYILECIYSLKQEDSILSSDLTIEHLLNDDGSIENSSIWNMTLTSEKVNSNLLKDKGIKEKLKILKEKSTIKENIELDKYLNDNIFDSERRKNDIIEILFEEIFVLNETIFNIKEEEVKKYRSIEKKLKSNNDLEMLELLKEKGIFFEIYLKNNKSLKSYKEKYDKYK